MLELCRAGTWARANAGAGATAGLKVEHGAKQMLEICSTGTRANAGDKAKAEHGPRENARDRA